MEPLTLVVGVLTVFLIVAFIFARTEGLAFLGPKSTRAMRASAQAFCSERCRADGKCPLTGTAEAAENCPLFKYIGADVPTALYGSPFEGVTE